MAQNSLKKKQLFFILYKTETCKVSKYLLLSFLLAVVLAVNRDLLTFERTLLENGKKKRFFGIVGTPICLTISVLYLTLNMNFIP